MKNPVYEQILATKVKASLRVLLRLGRNAVKGMGLAGLRDQPRRPNRIRFAFLLKPFRSFSGFARIAFTGKHMKASSVGDPSCPCHRDSITFRDCSILNGIRNLILLSFFA